MKNKDKILDKIKKLLKLQNSVELRTIHIGRMNLLGS